MHGLWREGPGRSQTPTDRYGRINKVRLPHRGNPLLQLRGLQLFTPAALYLHGGWTDQLWCDYMAAQGDVVFYHDRFGSKIFSGLELGSDSDWNYVLWAVERRYWESLVNFCCSIVTVGQRLGPWRGVGLQYLRVLDPLNLVNPTQTMTVGAFGVRGPNRCLAFTQALFPRLQLFDAVSKDLLSMPKTWEGL